MCETKAVLVLIPINFTAISKLLHFLGHTENKTGHHSEIKSQGPCENKYTMY